MERKIDYQITADYQNRSIEYFLRQMGYTRNVIVLLKQTENGILCNGSWAYTRDLLSAGDRLSIYIKEPEVIKENILPVCLPVSIVYEDADLLVVNKPAHMPIHPSIHHYDHTLANAILYHYQSQNTFGVFRCINRLDRDTTGLTIIAKHVLSAAILNQQMLERSIHRTYHAICRGKTPASGTIDAPIARCSHSTVERQVDFVNGESAVTHYQRLAYDPSCDLSFLALQLETGRTHQIRVHMKYIGHPLIGDFLYYPEDTYIKRQALHSACLDFVHPITKEAMHFTAELPADMKCLFPLI